VAEQQVLAGAAQAAVAFNQADRYPRQQPEERCARYNGQDAQEALI
jgi:hypothetical protein